MKAIRTIDTHEWVSNEWDEERECWVWQVNKWPDVFSEETLLREIVIRDVAKETCHLCEWVDVEIVVKDHVPDVGKMVEDHLTDAGKMMTAEEFIHKQIGISVNADKLTPMDHGECVRCMTDYVNYVSEIQAVRFAEFKDNECYDVYQPNSTVKMFGIHKKSGIYTLNELFQKWKEDTP